jgi:signal transduction histidine kinase
LNITDSLSTECILPNEDVLAIYRCAQEIANNINKHSEAQTVKIEFYSDENTKLKISFLDDGVGFEEENKEDSYGLRNIRNRLKDIGAKLEINSVKGRGTSVTIIYN